MQGNRDEEKAVGSTSQAGDDEPRGKEFETSFRETVTELESHLQENRDKKPEAAVMERHWAAGGGREPAEADEQAAAAAATRSKEAGEQPKAPAPVISSNKKRDDRDDSHWNLEEWKNSIGEGAGNHHVGDNVSLEEKSLEPCYPRADEGHPSKHQQNVAQYIKKADEVSVNAREQKREANAEAYLTKEVKEAEAEAARRIAEIEAHERTEVAKIRVKEAAEEERAEKIKAAAQAESQRRQAEVAHRAQQAKLEAEHKMRLRIADANQRANDILAGAEVESKGLMEKMAENLGLKSSI